jgi:hypothetical protein
LRRKGFTSKTDDGRIDRIIRKNQRLILMHKIDKKTGGSKSFVKGNYRHMNL